MPDSNPSSDFAEDARTLGPRARLIEEDSTESEAASPSQKSEKDHGRLDRSSASHCQSEMQLPKPPKPDAGRVIWRRAALSLAFLVIVVFGGANVIASKTVAFQPSQQPPSAEQRVQMQHMMALRLLCARLIGRREYVMASLSNLAGFYEATGDKSKAVDCLQECLKWMPADSRFYSHETERLRKLYVETGEFAKAEALVLPIVAQLNARGANHTQLYDEAAYIAFKLGKFDQSRQLSKAAFFSRLTSAELPEIGVLHDPDETTMEALFNAGSASMANGDYEQAKKLYRFCFSKDIKPTRWKWSTAAVVMMPVASTLMGDYETAAAEFKWAFPAIASRKASGWNDPALEQILYHHYAMFLRNRGDLAGAQRNEDIANKLQIAENND